MRVLLGDEWEDGFLDEHRAPRAYRVQVLAWRNLERLDDLYFVRRGTAGSGPVRGPSLRVL